MSYITEGNVLTFIPDMTILQKHLVFIPLFCIVFIGVFGGCVMLLWNWLMPDLFGLATISFWQAAGLLLLCKILFGGFGGGHHGHDHCGGNKLRERWEELTPEERERIMEAHRAQANDHSATLRNQNEE